MKFGICTDWKKPELFEAVKTAGGAYMTFLKEYLAPSRRDPDDYAGFLRDLAAIGYTSGVSVEGRFAEPFCETCREA